MNQDNTSRSVRLPTYDGDKDNFALYNARMSAYAVMYGFAEANKRRGGSESAVESRRGDR